MRDITSLRLALVKTSGMKYSSLSASTLHPVHTLERGETDATLAHRMGEGLGVRASGDLSKSFSTTDGPGCTRIRREGLRESQTELRKTREQFPTQNRPAARDSKR